MILRSNCDHIFCHVYKCIAYAFQNSVVLARDLRKEFIKGEGGCCKKKEESIKVAVHHNSFIVYPGEVFGLLGPNGAGKSTTLNMVIAEEGPTKGTVS